MRPTLAYTLVAATLVAQSLGCRSIERFQYAAPTPPAPRDSPAEVATADFEQATDVAPSATEIVPAMAEAIPLEEITQPELIAPGNSIDPPEEVPAPPPTINQVIASVRMHFPLIEQAAAGRVIASGQALEAAGAFDRKLDLFSESQPLGFYENYRNSVTVKRDTMWGGQTFAGYRIGRGDFEPWYLERQTNEGGEFKVGFVAPVIRDRAIDSNRSQLWQAQLERGRIEPVVRAQVIQSVRDGAMVYWQWVAAAAVLHVAEGVLELAEDRAKFLSRQVEEGEKAEIDLVDNRRIIVSRQAKLTDARRKLEQAAFKLSLFLRTPTGEPLLIDAKVATGVFPDTIAIEELIDASDEMLALANRPELIENQIVRRQLSVAMQQAVNEMLPDVDAGLLVSQDVGEPTSSTRDKSELELEALLTLSVPLERRKALGKARQLRGKLAQVRAKLQFAEEKIITEVQVARAALVAAAQRLEQTQEGVELARRMQSAEQRLYQEGQSTLLNVNLRELQAAEAAVEVIATRLEYFVALADYQAALGMDGGPEPFNAGYFGGADAALDEFGVMQECR